MSETPRTLRDEIERRFSAAIAQDVEYHYANKLAKKRLRPILDALLSAPDAPQEIERHDEGSVETEDSARPRLSPDAVRETPPAWADEFDRRLQAKLTPALNSGTAMELLVVVGEVLREMREAD